MNTPGPPPPPDTLLAEAISQFNRGEFFACHETLEGLWMPSTGDVRQFYQGLIQVAAGLHHVQQGNFAGAQTLLRRGVARLGLLVPAHLGLDVAALLRDVAPCLYALQEAEAAGEKGFDRALIPKVSLERFDAGRQKPASPEATEPD